MSLYSQNVSNNPLGLDGLIVGNFDEVYVDGVPITPTDITGLVPYVGATTAVDLNSKKIMTTYVPVNDEDLTNKLYNDGRYLKISGFSVSSGGFVFDTGSNVYIQGNLYMPVLTTATPSFTLGLDGAGKVIQSTGGTGDAILSAGTLISPQNFSGYNQFANVLRTNSIINGTGITTGTITLTTTVAGTAVNQLGIDAFGTMVLTGTSSIPTQLNTTFTTTSASFYPVFVNNYTSGVKTVLTMDGVLFNPSTQLFEASNIKSAGTTTCVGTLFTQSGITNTAGQFLITDNLRSPNTGMTFIIPSASATFGFQNNTTELAKIDTTGITCSRYNAPINTNMIFNVSSSTASVYSFVYRFNGTTFLSASNVGVEVTPTLFANTIEGYSGAPFSISATGGGSLSISATGGGGNYVSIQGVQFTTADILTLTSQIFYSSKIYAQAGLNLLYNVNTGYNHNFNVNGVNTLYINAGGLVMNGGNAINCANIENSTLTNFNMGGVTRFAITQNGGWLPPDGSSSLYIRDTYTTSTTTYGRYFGVGSVIYQDFYNYFSWRRTNNVDGSGVSELMALQENGLVLRNCQNLGQPQIVFAGSGVPTIRMDGGGMNWFMNSTTNMGYFDAGGFTSGGGVAGTGWRINGNEGLTLKSGRGIYLQQGFGAVNATINSIVTHSGTGTSKWGSNGWFAFGGAQVCSYDPVGNVSNGIGMGVSYDNNWCYISMVKPGNYWSQGIIETGNANWYVNGSLAAYITGGGWTNVSDERCKCDINDLSTKKSLQRVLKCKPKYYKRIIQEAEGEMPIQNKQEDLDRIHIGLLAQDVQEFNPHCVSTWKDGDDEHEKLGIQYNDFVIHLIGAVQEQQKTINTLLDHVARLTEQVNQLTLKMI